MTRDVLQVARQLSQLTVADGQQQQRQRQSPRASTAAAVGSGPAGGGRGVGPGQRVPRPPPSAFVRRLSAPGPTGPAAAAGVEPGSRKPWSYTPSFGVGNGGTGRVSSSISSRPM